MLALLKFGEKNLHSFHEAIGLSVVGCNETAQTLSITMPKLGRISRLVGMGHKVPFGRALLPGTPSHFCGTFNVGILNTQCPELHVRL